MIQQMKAGRNSVRVCVSAGACGGGGRAGGEKERVKNINY